MALEAGHVFRMLESGGHPQEAGTVGLLQPLSEGFALCAPHFEAGLARSNRLSKPVVTYLNQG